MPGGESGPLPAEEFIINFGFQFLVFFVQAEYFVPVLSLAEPEHPPQEAADYERAERNSERGVSWHCIIHNS